MISQIISFVYVVGGFKLLFETRKRYNIYLAIGFILYGLQYLLDLVVIDNIIVQIIFKIPKILGSLCLFMSPYYYLRGVRK
jgi:hypothetical protein